MALRLKDKRVGAQEIAGGYFSVDGSFPTVVCHASRVQQGHKTVQSDFGYTLDSTEFPHGARCGLLG